MSNEMKIKGFGSWANGKWHLTGKAVWAREKQTRFRRDHPQIGYFTGLRNIKTGGHAGPESAQGELTGRGKRATKGKIS